MPGRLDCIVYGDEAQLAYDILDHFDITNLTCNAIDRVFVHHVRELVFFRLSSLRQLSHLVCRQVHSTRCCCGIAGFSLIARL